MSTPDPYGWMRWRRPRRPPIPWLSGFLLVMSLPLVPLEVHRAMVGHRAAAGRGGVTITFAAGTPVERTYRRDRGYRSVFVAAGRSVQSRERPHAGDRFEVVGDQAYRLGGNRWKDDVVGVVFATVLALVSGAYLARGIALRRRAPTP